MKYALASFLFLTSQLLFGNSELASSSKEELLFGSYYTTETGGPNEPLKVWHRPEFNVTTITIKRSSWKGPGEMDLVRDPNSGVYHGTAIATHSGSNCNFNYSIDIAPIAFGGFNIREKFPTDADRSESGECTLIGNAWHYTSKYRITRSSSDDYIYREWVRRSATETEKMQRQFHAAAFRGDLPEVESLLDKVDINNENWRGESALGIAAISGRLNVVEKLSAISQLDSGVSFSLVKGIALGKYSSTTNVDRSTYMKIIRVLAFAKSAPKSWAAELAYLYLRQHKTDEVLDIIDRSVLNKKQLDYILNQSLAWYHSDRSNDVKNADSGAFKILTVLSSKDLSAKHWQEWFVSIYPIKMRARYYEMKRVCTVSYWGDNDLTEGFKLFVSTGALGNRELGPHLVDALRCERVPEAGEVVDYLLKAGVDINFTDPDDRRSSILYYAVYQLWPEWVDYLIAKGAELDRIIGEYDSDEIRSHVIVALAQTDPIYFKEIVEMLDRLLELGVPLDAKSDKGYNLLDALLYNIYCHTHKFRSKDCSDQRHRAYIKLYNELKRRGLSLSGSLPDEIRNSSSIEFATTLCD